MSALPDNIPVYHYEDEAEPDPFIAAIAQSFCTAAQMIVLTGAFVAWAVFLAGMC